jgi:hypothetical protein
VVEDMGLKTVGMALSPYQISINLPSGSKVISRGQADRQTGDFISLISFFFLEN